MSVYPKRESYFAHRFVRLLTKTAAANEVSSDACWLLTVVAMQEDSKRYTGAVTYYNDQLMPLCGFGGKSRLVTARDRAIAGGWLHYEKGRKKKPGRYWVTIPAEYESLPDGTCDESDSENCRPESEQEIGFVVPNQDDMRTASGRQTDGNTSSFIPIPKPSPKRARFVAPSVDDVAAYCEERGNSINPATFHDHYEANGWVQGKHKPIKDWRAAVRKWESNGIDRTEKTLSRREEIESAGFTFIDATED